MGARTFLDEDVLSTSEVLDELVFKFSSHVGGHLLRVGVLFKDALCHTQCHSHS